MPGAYLFGFDVDTGAKVKVICTAEGKLLIDPTLILENPPTEDESKKAPTSEWAFDHKANASDHHAKYTAANAREAINDIFGADGFADKNIDLARNELLKVERLFFSALTDNAAALEIRYQDLNKQLLFSGKNSAGAYTAFALMIYDTVAWRKVATELYVDSKVAIVKGTHYWSCSGNAFSAQYPDVNDVKRSITGKIITSADGINLICPVNLPNGATVTGVIVYGNAAATAETWYLSRNAFSDGTRSEMAESAIETEDATISNPVIDNSLYSYFLRTTTLDTNDEIWGARITYTL